MKRKSIYRILACCTIVCAFTACTDVWDEHYKMDDSMLGQTGDSYLWELIKDDPDLEEFSALLKATGYDTLLMTNRSYTIWAPVDGSGFIDVATLGQATKEQLDAYRKEIVENHIANYVHAASGIRDKEDRKNYAMVEMLNTKKYDFESVALNEYTFDGIAIDASNSNIVAKNGMLHRLETGYVDFAANIWEQLSRVPKLSKLWAFLKKDYKKEFNPAGSVQGPIEDGKVTWLERDSIESCRWFGEIGYLAREDSSYTMYALSDDAWDDMYKTAKRYFKYPSSMVTLPSKGSLTAEKTTDSIVYNLMVRNLVFSNTVNKKFFNGQKDTLIANAYPQQMFAGEEAHALKEGWVDTFALSNGTLYVVDQVNYNPFTCWFDTVRVQGEHLSDGDANRKGFKSVVKSSVNIHRDSLLYDRVSGHSIGVYKAEGNGYKIDPQFTFYVNDLLSAAYRIKIVLLPPQIINPADTTFIKPNKFTALLSADSLKLQLTNDEGLPLEYVSDVTKIDTIVLFDYVEFNTCEYQKKGLTGKEPSTYLEIKSKIEFTGRNGDGENRGTTKKPTTPTDSIGWNYDNDFRIDEVIFEPINFRGE